MPNPGTSRTQVTAARQAARGRYWAPLATGRKWLGGGNPRCLRRGFILTFVASLAVGRRRQRKRRPDDPENSLVLSRRIPGSGGRTALRRRRRPRDARVAPQSAAGSHCTGAQPRWCPLASRAVRRLSRPDLHTGFVASTQVSSGFSSVPRRRCGGGIRPRLDQQRLIELRLDLGARTLNDAEIAAVHVVGETVRPSLQSAEFDLAVETRREERVVERVAFADVVGLGRSKPMS